MKATRHLVVGMGLLLLAGAGIRSLAQQSGPAAKGTCSDHGGARSRDRRQAGHGRFLPGGARRQDPLAASRSDAREERRPGL